MSVASQIVYDLNQVIDKVDRLALSAADSLPRWYEDDDASEAMARLEESSDALRKARLALQRLDRKED